MTVRYVHTVDDDGILSNDGGCGCNILMQSIKASDPVLDMSRPENIQLSRSLMADQITCNGKSFLSSGVTL